MIDALAEEFEVSGLPVREAIRRLEAEGLVIYRPNAGAQVAPADPGLFDEEMTVLAVLEGYGTALAAPCMDDEAIARLREINDEMAAAMAELDSLRFGRLNQEFHGLIYEYCPNSALVGMLSDVARRLDAIRRTVFVQIPYRGATLGRRAPRADRADRRRRAGREDREGRARAQAQHRPHASARSRTGARRSAGSPPAGRPARARSAPLPQGERR